MSELSHMSQLLSPMDRMKWEIHFEIEILMIYDAQNTLHWRSIYDLYFNFPCSSRAITTYDFLGRARSEGNG